MENISVLERTGIMNSYVKTNFCEKSPSDKRSNINPVLKKLISEGSEDFYQYINWLGIAREQSLIVLPSRSYYYYTLNDFKGIKILINLENLNHIQHPDNFLRSISQILPVKAYFIGLFKNNQIGSGTIICQFAKIFNGIINCMDYITGKSISKKCFTILLEKNNFRIVNNTEINGMTYFCSQNIKRFNE